MQGLKWTCSLVNFKVVLGYTGIKKVNEHGHATICGYIQKEEEEQLLYGNTGTCFATIEVEGEGGKKMVLFAGVVEQI